MFKWFSQTPTDTLDEDSLIIRDLEGRVRAAHDDLRFERESLNRAVAYTREHLGDDEAVMEATIAAIIMDNATNISMAIRSLERAEHSLAEMTRVIAACKEGK